MSYTLREVWPTIKGLTLKSTMDWFLEGMESLIQLLESFADWRYQQARNYEMWSWNRTATSLVKEDVTRVRMAYKIFESLKTQCSEQTPSGVRSFYFQTMLEGLPTWVRDDFDLELMEYAYEKTLELRREKCAT